MNNSKCSFHVKVRKVEISPILNQGSFKRFEDSALAIHVLQMGKYLFLKPSKVGRTYKKNLCKNFGSL